MSARFVHRWVPVSLCALLCWTEVAGGCRERPKAQRQAKQPPAKGIDRGDPALARAARAAIAGCPAVKDSLQPCPGAALDELTSREQALGPRGALLTYCLGLDEAGPLQDLALARLQRLSFPRSARQADEQVLTCLVDNLRRRGEDARFSLLARPAVLVATSLRREEAVLELLSRSRSLPSREAGYQALWAGGRLRVIDRLVGLLRSERTPAVRVAILTGLTDGGRWEPAEEQRLCPVLASLLKDKDAVVAETSAQVLAGLCPAQAELLLEDTDRLVEEGALTLARLRALRALIGFSTRRATAAQRKRLAGILARLVESSLTGPIRGGALTLLAEIDAKSGTKLARKHRGRNPSVPKELRLSAEELLRGR